MVADVFCIDVLFRASFAVLFSCFVVIFLKRKIPVVVRLKKLNERL